jgi:hypothetical protein
MYGDKAVIQDPDTFKDKIKVLEREEKLLEIARS